MDPEVKSGRQLIVTLKSWEWKLPPTLEVPLEQLPELTPLRVSLAKYGRCFLSQPYSEVASGNLAYMLHKLILRFPSRKAKMLEVMRELQESGLVDRVEIPAHRSAMTPGT